MTKYLLLTVILLLSNFIKLYAQEIGHAYQQRVENLAASPKIKVAFQHIVKLEPETLKDMISLTEIPAPTFEEEEKGKTFAEMLLAAGADSVWTDEAGNIIGLRKGTVSRRTILIEGHLDTVFPFETDVSVSYRGDTLYAPGIGDDNRGLAVVLAILKTMEKVNIRTTHDIWFVGTVGEEGLGDLFGVKHLFRDGGHPISAYISVDGSRLENITNGGIGSLRYKVNFKGPGGHSYGAFGIGNPHNALANAIATFVPIADTFTKEGPKTTYSISVVGGGTSVNSIPYESFMLVDMRSESQEKLEGLKNLFLPAMQQGLEIENAIIRMGEPLTLEIEQVGNRPSGITDPNHPLVQQTMAIVQHLTGNPPILGSSSTNSNMPLSLGIPSVTIGGGGMGGGAHSLGEWWVNQEGYKGIQLGLLLLLLQGEFE
jgi:tripeptide aminopeptidase